MTERLDLAVASEFRGGLVRLIKAGHRNLVIDLGTVSFIDSSGLGALISALKMLKTSRERRRAPRPEPPRRPAAGTCAWPPSNRPSSRCWRSSGSTGSSRAT